MLSVSESAGQWCPFDSAFLCVLLPAWLLRQTFWVGMALPTEPSQPVLGIWVIRRKGGSVLLERGKWIFLNQSVTTGWFYFSRIRARRNIAVTERVKP